MKNLYSLAVAQLTVGGTGSEAGVTPVGEEDMEWMKENFVLDQLNAAISALGTEEVRSLTFLLSPLHLLCLPLLRLGCTWYLFFFPT